MNENTHDAVQEALESRSRALFQDSVVGLDMPMRSRLTQARHAALDAAASARPWFLRMPLWTPAAGVAAAALLGVALWVGGASTNHGMGTPANLEDLDIVASTDGSSGDAMEMLQDDIDFYDFADKAASSDPSA
jgi:negative regulator of sigma E activity